MTSIASLMCLIGRRREGTEACAARIKIQGNHGTGQKFSPAMWRRTQGALSSSSFFFFLLPVDVSEVL